MSHELKWLPTALADFERLYDFLHEKNTDAACRAAQAILDGAEFLRVHPALGRPMDDDSGRREWMIPFGAGTYILRYMLDAQVPVIIRVWHSRESRS